MAAHVGELGRPHLPNTPSIITSLSKSMSDGEFLTTNYLPAWEVAQPVSDDPDTVYHDYLNHIYDVWGLLRIGTGPPAVKAHLALASVGLRAGDTAGAGREAALMAPY